MTILLSNPYTNTSFWQFIALFFYRIPGLLTGAVEPATDDIQVAVLCCTAISAALVGTFLVLRQMTMMANALSHTILVGVVIAYILTQFGSQGYADAHAHHGMQLNLSAMLLGSIIMGIVTTLLTQLLTHTFSLQSDASCGLVFTTLFAIGIIAVTVATRSAHIGAEVVMGNVDALLPQDLGPAALLMVMNLFLTWLFFKEYALTSFDRAFAASIGFSALFFDYTLMVQTSLTTISGFRAVGVLMVLALMTAPVLTARLFTHRLHTLLLFAMAIGCLGCLTGVALARHLLSVYAMPISTAGVTVCLLTAFFAAASILTTLFRLYWRYQNIAGGQWVTAIKDKG